MEKYQGELIHMVVEQIEDLDRWVPSLACARGKEMACSYVSLITTKMHKMLHGNNKEPSLEANKI